MVVSSRDRVSYQVGAALRRLRHEHRLSATQLAARAGITRAMLSHYEHGQHHPSLPSLVKILLTFPPETGRTGE
jgi:transcriptional regulator with XRE-family HTH domain